MIFRALSFKFSTQLYKIFHYLSYVQRIEVADYVIYRFCHFLNKSDLELFLLEFAVAIRPISRLHGDEFATTFLTATK